MATGYTALARSPTIVVVGLGNIGSQIVPLLNGVTGVSRVILIDGDRYGVSNLGHQRISASHVGQLKVKVQARALRTLAAHMAVDTYACPVDAVPLGKLRDCVILGCVDSRSARQSINRIAFRLGAPWIDAGLDRAGSVRARVYLPGMGDCLECNWGPRDYELLEQRIPCNAASSAVPATAAPPELGAIAAGMQIALLRRLLLDASSDAHDHLARQQWFLDVPSGRGWIGRYTQNPSCRFDHSRWPITPLARSARDLTLRETFVLSGADAGDAVLSVDGQTIVRCVRCTGCGSVKKVGGRILARMALTPCTRCGGMMTPAAADAFDRLSLSDAVPAWLDRPLAALGLVGGDVITLHAREAALHYELGSTSAEAR